MSKEYRHIVRIMGKDIDGTKYILNGLTNIKGIGKSLANAIIRTGEIRPNARVGYLTESEVEKLEKVIGELGGSGVPAFILNRQKDLDSGRDMHLVGPDLELKIKTDIDFMRELKTWKGVRHSFGLKVRGQRTKSTGRKGKAVGVKKKTLIASARAK
ncbi:MAG: 30S ribosomal protein S13 [Candidatus Bathyarchaeota archaeon]|nr:30S ribosomal protein S13 [Candidatus Bathyarchaeota archaeon]